ncbi:hypothetical protein [Methylobacterium oryzae]|uniref:hypothetical protein n=1 Tax=Methylobacterium oryzae TaxID=334852 RepID=UPI001F22E0C0|nr:hypothetical protein [Methylobacterium oryzae]UIN38332.1 hypothetical protein LXM90_31345 [Methylobacterium oryzae]
MPAHQRPSVGRIVHYHPRDAERVSISDQPYGAIVTGVFEAGDGADICSLTVFAPGRKAEPLPECVREGGPDQPGTWPFPPRV